MDIVDRRPETITIVNDDSSSHSAFAKFASNGNTRSSSKPNVQHDNDRSHQYFANSKQLVADFKSEQLLLAYDVFLLLVPLILVAKSALCIVAYNIDMWQRGYNIGSVSYLTVFLVNFNSQASTFFTIVFITIISTSVRRWALYKAQQGAQLAELKQLQASISLPSTVKVIWSLRCFGIMSGSLLFVWCFYYLGSQACQHEYVIADSKPFHKVRLAMVSPVVTSDLATEAGDPNLLKATYASMGQTLATTYAYQNAYSNSKPYDSMGNVRVPLIETLSGDKEILAKRLERGDWIEVGDVYTHSFATFSGLSLWQNYSYNEFGPIYDYANFTFDDSQQFLGELNLTSRYTYVNCSLPAEHDYSAFPSGTLDSSYISINFTKNSRGYNKEGHPTIPKQFELWARWNTTNLPVSTGSVSTLCSLTTTVVDVQADCQPLGCIAKRARYNPYYLLPSPITPFENDTFADDFFNHMLLSLGPLSVENSLGNYTSAGVGPMIDLDTLLHCYEDPANYGGDLLSSSIQSGLQRSSENLATVINTYYAASVSTTCYASLNDTLNSDCIYWTGRGAVYNQQYLLSVPWIVMDFISCFILIAAAIFSYWLRTRTLAPDIFGYVSSLTRENPHFDLPIETGSALSGLERARVMGNVRIKIGEYRQGNGPPRVILSHIAEGYEAEPLKKEEKYV